MYIQMLCEAYFTDLKRWLSVAGSLGIREIVARQNNFIRVLLMNVT
jgi:hypothetical protein